MKKKIYRYLSLCGLVILTAACNNKTTSTTATTSTAKSESSSQVTNVSTTLTSGETYGKYEAEDLEESYDESSATTIKLSDEKTTIEGEGVTVDGQTITIDSAGTYILSGTLSDGQVRINASKEETVRLILKDVTINNQSSSAIYVQQAQKVITTLAEGTVNKLSDGSEYTLSEGETEPDATFFSKEDLTINGSGSLEITGNYSNGIRSKDDLVITNGNYKITAKNNGLKGKDSISIKSGNFDITTEEGDGIQSNNTTDGEKGWVGIDGGTFTIKSGRDGIQAETSLLIKEATMTIQTADGYTSQSIDSTNESYKGLKASGQITIDNGTFEIDSADDGIHSNGDIVINNGTYTISTGDDGIHADNNLTLTDGEVTVKQSYEGLEASVININGGNHSITADDDGINAGGGSDTTSGNSDFGGGGDVADESKQININGGTTFVNAEGDGIDSNGNVTMNDGTLIVNGPVNGGNGALDYNGEFQMKGGTLLASGTSDMAMTVSENSTQAALDVYFDSVQTAETIINITDSNGSVLATFQPTKEFSHFVISTPDLKIDEEISLSINGTATGTAKNGWYESGEYSGGTKLFSTSLSSILTSVSESGETVSGNQMGGMGAPR